MPAVNFKAKNLKGVSSHIETCDVLNCTKSGRYWTWFLDHKYDKWLLCSSHKTEMINTLKEVLPQDAPC